MNIPGYTLERRIGSGGQAMVYEAIQESLQRRVALKVMNPVFSGNAEFTERFLNEGRILANLGHSHVITIHDIGVVGDLHYLSMELVEGGDLRTRMRRGLDPETALDYIAIIADCLRTAHGKQVVHRDIKPANVLFRRDGTLLLTDFGIAKRLGTDSDLTLTGTTLGSPSYLSPEQAQNWPLDGRADIYSLGAMAFEMLTGCKPYTASSEVATIQCHLSAPLPELPAALAAYQPLVDRMMAKSPEDRFANAGELIEALRALRPCIPVREQPVLDAMPGPAGGEPTMPTLPPTRVVPEPAPPAPAADVTITQLNPRARRRRRVRGPLALAAAAVVVFTLSAAVGHFSRNSRLPDVPATASILEGTSLLAPAPGGESVAAPGSVAGQRAPAFPAGAGALNVAATRPERVTAAAGPGAVAGESAVVEVESAAVAVEMADHGGRPAAALEDVSGSARVSSLLASAQSAIDDLRLTRPRENSALHFYEQVLAIDPGNAQARDGRRTIAERYADLAESARSRGEGGKARGLVERGLSVDAGNARLLRLAVELHEEEVRTADAAPVEEEVRTAEASATDARGEIRGESPGQLFRRIKGWFN